MGHDREADGVWGSKVTLGAQGPDGCTLATHSGVVERQHTHTHTCRNGHVAGGEGV